MSEIQHMSMREEFYNLYSYTREWMNDRISGEEYWLEFAIAPVEVKVAVTRTMIGRLGNATVAF